MNKTYLVHHGIKGQRWGIRRYQDEDGSLTPLGKKRYDINEDGTVNLKEKYRKGQINRALIKTAAGTALATKGVAAIVKSRAKKNSFTTKTGKKLLNESILAMLIGSVVVASGAKNLVNAYSNRTFNTTGMGPTPETFTGKSKTRKQVIASKNRSKR